MLKKLFGNHKKNTETKASPKPSLATPDISRVIKLTQAAPATLTEQPMPTPDVADEQRFEDAKIAEARAEAAIESMADKFETWMTNDLDNLSKAWEDARTTPSPEAYRAIFTAAHNIRGVAGSYGYPAISRLAGSLCTLLTKSKPGENGALINLHVEACRAAHKSIGHGGGANSVADAVCEALENRVAMKTGSVD